MDSKKGLDIISNVNDLANIGSDLIKDEAIDSLLSTFGDFIPPARLFIKGCATISDKLFFTKIDKFMKFAELNEENLSSKEEKKFEEFKEKMKEDADYRTKVSQYVLFKIDKFDDDVKLNVFSKACLDFFKGNINFELLNDISECIDMISRKDIMLLNYLFKSNKTNGFVFTPETCYAKGLIPPEINSVIKKLNMLSILEECDDIMYETVSSDTSDHSSQRSTLTKSYIVSQSGSLLAKYLS